MSSPTPYKVLCVCLGNICRSPTAEVVLRQRCDEHKLKVEVDSAGTSNYHPGKAPDARSQKHAALRGYDLSGLRARQLTSKDFLDFDLILAMDKENLKNIEQFANKALQEHGYINAQIALMSAHDTKYPKQALPDPYYEDGAAFERVLDQCESSVQGWIQVFKAQQLLSDVE